MSSEADDTSEDAPPDGSSRHLLSASKHTSAPAAAQEAIMNGTLRSDNCHIAMSINASTFKVEVYYAKAVNYTLMLTTLSLLQVWMPRAHACNLLAVHNVRCMHSTALVC